MLLVTAVTNLSCIPAIFVLKRQGRQLHAFVGGFTFAVSVMYHICDSIDRPVWLTEGQWHRLDNIGSIWSFMGFFVYLLDVGHREVVC
jgi:hypothetical protein